MGYAPHTPRAVTEALMSQAEREGRTVVKVASVPRGKRQVCWAADPELPLGYCTLKIGHTGPHQWERVP